MAHASSVNAPPQGARRPPPLPVRGRPSTRPQPQTPGHARAPGGRAGGTATGVHPVENAVADPPRNTSPSGSNALTAELREQMQSAIRTAVAQALAPFIRKQTEIEQAVESAVAEFRRGLAERAARPSPPPLPVTASVATPAARPVPVVAASLPATQADPAWVTAATTNTVKTTTPATTMTAATPMTAATAGNNGATSNSLPAAKGLAPAIAQAVLARDMTDVPWQLSGARRRRTVAWVLGAVAAVGLGALTVAVVLSQLGYKV